MCLNVLIRSYLKVVEYILYSICGADFIKGAAQLNISWNPTQMLFPPFFFFFLKWIYNKRVFFFIERKVE